jgi:hypothetical protein
MACEAPVEAWRPSRGGPLSFKPPKDGHHWTPIQVPCGTCILCRQEQSRQWAVRIAHEASLHDQNSFLTLTYRDDQLPQRGSLDYSHLQKFFKRVRKAGYQFRYYAVGEYGDTTHRPHYHVCMFGQAWTHRRIIIREKPHLLWTSLHLEELWGLGQVTIGELNYATASYTAGYIHKKLNKKQTYVVPDEKTGELLPIGQPRALMSRRPGIGHDWYQSWKKYTYDHDHVVLGGSPGKPPKYYDNKLKEENEKLYDNIKTKRRGRASHAEPERLRARARNAHARASLRTRGV